MRVREIEGCGGSGRRRNAHAMGPGRRYIHWYPGVELYPGVRKSLHTSPSQKFPLLLLEVKPGRDTRLPAYMVMLIWCSATLPSTLPSIMRPSSRKLLTVRVALSNQASKCWFLDGASAEMTEICREKRVCLVLRPVSS